MSFCNFSKCANFYFWPVHQWQYNMKFKQQSSVNRDTLRVCVKEYFLPSRRELTCSFIPCMMLPARCKFLRGTLVNLHSLPISFTSTQFEFS